MLEHFPWPVRAILSASARGARRSECAGVCVQACVCAEAECAGQWNVCDECRRAYLVGVMVHLMSVDGELASKVLDEGDMTCKAQDATIQHHELIKYHHGVQGRVAEQWHTPVCERTRSVNEAGSGSQGRTERVQSGRGRTRRRSPAPSSAPRRAELCKRVGRGAMRPADRPLALKSRYRLFAR